MEVGWEGKGEWGTLKNHALTEKPKVLREKQNDPMRRKILQVSKKKIKVRHKLFSVGD